MDNKFDLKVFEDDLNRFCILISNSMDIYNTICEYAKDLKEIIEKLGF